MYDTRAVRQALKALGSEPAPVPVEDDRRVVLAGGGNEIAMSLYRAMGRGSSQLSEAQVRQRQEEMLAQFEREAQQVLRMLGAFRTVISLEDERAARRGLPVPEEVTVVTTGTGTLHHAAVGAEAVPVRPGATYRLRGHPALASEADVGAEEPVVGRWEGTSVSTTAAALDNRVQRLRMEDRVAPDMETCEDCRKTVMFDPHDGSFSHEDGSPAYSKDGHIVHADTLERIVDAERLREMADAAPKLTREEAERQFPGVLVSEPSRTKAEQTFATEVRRLEAEGFGVQQGPAMDTEEEAKKIVRRAVEAARADIEADRARTAHYDRDSGIEPGSLDSTDLDLSPIESGAAEHGLGRRVRNRLERWRRYLDGWTAREMDELERHQQRRR